MQTITGEVDRAHDALEMNDVLFGERTRTIVVGANKFILEPSDQSDPFTKGRWVESPVGAGVGDPFAPSKSAASRLSTDPIVVLDRIEGVTHDVHLVGMNPVRGHVATQYSAEVTIQDALARLPADQRANFRRAAAVGAISAEALDVWIQDGHVVQIQSSTTSNGVTSTIQVDYYDFGAALTIEAPPPSRVISATVVEKEAEAALKKLGG